MTVTSLMQRSSKLASPLLGEVVSQVSAMDRDSSAGLGTIQYEISADTDSVVRWEVREGRV
jgi:hypothetical protein